MGDRPGSPGCCWLFAVFILRATEDDLNEDPLVGDNKKRKRQRKEPKPEQELTISNEDYRSLRQGVVGDHGSGRKQRGLVTAGSSAVGEENAEEVQVRGFCIKFSK